MNYCAGCGKAGYAPCQQCGSWEFVDKGGLELLNKVGRIDPNLKPAGSSSRSREQKAHGTYGSTGKVYSKEQVKKILRRQRYRDA